MITCLRKRKNLQNTDESIFLMKNGQILLEKSITSCNGKCNLIRGFTTDELKNATDNYALQKVIRDGYVYKLYEGVLQDRTVSIMKFNDVLDDCEDCFNNIVFSSRISICKNVLKLTGCYLDTRIPILVFELVQFGTIANHIYHHSHFEALELSQRLKIAMGIANAVAYLYFGFPKPVVFLNIKPSRIFLNENYVAKLFDFSLSVTIPEGEM
ncbi:non-functional pseudokinase ZED1-like [Pistacia vera]|uniref:non-functional pseudokinase ZED1-like n=1 Tax=Pistacia vera TaxID=55513 RepID=UPI001262DF00|nr:non-functional pseudokinase ZED1-like [Pistacia vera]